MFEQINNELKEALKNGDKFKLSVLRMLKSSLQQEQINKKDKLTDEEILAVIKKQVKVRKASVEEYLSYAGIQDEVYNCGVSEVTKDSIIMPDYNDEYCMFVKKMIKKNGTTPNFVLNAFYYENCPLRQYYKI